MLYCFTGRSGTISSSSSSSITVRFRPTNTLYTVDIYEDMTVGDVIAAVCRQANRHVVNDCYLWFNSSELNNNDTILQAGLSRISNLTKDLPEVRLKYVQVLHTAVHIGKRVFLASPEQVPHDQLLNIPLPSTKKHTVPSILKRVAEQIIQRAPSSQRSGTVLIPLPTFSEQSIDSLPTIELTLPLSPNQFDWNVFLEQLASDLEIDPTDLIIVSAQEGSTKWKLKLKANVVYTSELIKKIEQKLLLMVIPKSEQFVGQHKPSSASKSQKIQIELTNFTQKNTVADTNNLSLDEMDLALRLSERPAIINDHSWNFMIDKSRRIRTSILQSIQLCTDEYIIDHAAIIYNEQIYDTYQKFPDTDQNEKILFHGTSTTNFDGIFEKNFQYDSGAKRTDDGWYGQGIYFSNSPKKALNYAKSKSKISHLICSLVRLGKTLTVTDMQYKGKPMHPNYDSHYIPIRIDGDPVSQGESPAFEEFVIKSSDRIMPLHVIGMMKVCCFVIWRDAKITNEANSTLFEAMKQRYPFNIYGAQTSVEALGILKIKLMNEEMRCVVVTNGADDGEGFVRECRSIHSSLPIVVYCQEKAYHQKWAATLPGPKINVTTSPEEVFDLITNTLQK